MKKKKILMYGLGTYKNRGVEAIVQSTLNQTDSTKLDIIPGNYDDIIKYNPLLMRSLKRPLKRNIISDYFEKYDFVTALDEIKKQFELEEYKKTIKDIESRNASLSIENIELANKLNNIYNSKRWKLIDKAINILNKIRRVK